MITVLANGCFDLLHVGHVRHLRQARDMGDCLIVALTLDENVNKGQGRPVYTWRERRDLLLGLVCVDAVIPSVSSIDAIKNVRPDIFVKGIDYVDGWAWTEDVKTACREVGAKLRFTTTEKFSATDAIMKVLACEHAKRGG